MTEFIAFTDNIIHAEHVLKWKNNVSWNNCYDICGKMQVTSLSLKKIFKAHSAS